MLVEGDAVTRTFCDWCLAEVDGQAALGLVPFMGSGQSGESVCAECEQEFTRRYYAAREFTRHYYAAREARFKPRGEPYR
jgi:hypothetical protein